MSLRVAFAVVLLGGLALPAAAAEDYQGKGWGVCVAEGPDASNHVSAYFQGEGSKTKDYEKAFAAWLNTAKGVQTEDGALCAVYPDKAGAERGAKMLEAINGGAEAAVVETGWKPGAA